MTQESSLALLRGRYQIRQPLGVGGMGAVYLAEDQNLAGKLVAVKQNKETLPEIQHQFNREAVLLANLNHSALPVVTDYFIEPDGRQFLVMEYIEGKNLGEILEENGGPLPEATVLSWMATIIEALDYLHNYSDPMTNQPRPIIHRDVKPANIKLKTNGQIYLVDFGLAKMADSSMTRPGSHGFTAGFSPLEQYGGQTSTRSDLYALGATLYVLLTGETPLGAPALLSGEALTAPRQLNPHITSNTEQVILRAMSTRPADRFQTINEMSSALFPQFVQSAPSTRRIDDQDNTTADDGLIGRLTKHGWHSGLAWLLVAVIVLFVLAIPLYITGIAGSTPVVEKLLEVGSNFYAGVQSWLSIWGPRLVPVAIIVAIVIIERAKLGILASQALHLSLRHLVRILVLLLPFSIALALYLSPVDFSTVAFLNRQPISGWLSWLTSAWFWVLVGFCVPGILVARSALVAIAARQQEKNYVSKATLALHSPFVTRPLQVATQVLGLGISTAKGIFSQPIPQSLEEPSLPIIPRPEVESLKNFTLARQGGRFLLTGYGRFGGTVLVTEATRKVREEYAQGALLIINFSVATDSTATADKQRYQTFKITANHLNLGVLSTRLFNDSAPEGALQNRIGSTKKSSTCDTVPLISHIPLKKRPVEILASYIFGRLSTVGNFNFDRFITDLNKALDDGITTHFLRRWIERLTESRNLPGRVIFVFDKIDHFETLQTLVDAQLFINKRITVIAVARKENFDRWQDGERRLKAIEFRPLYVSSVWSDRQGPTGIDYIKAVIKRRLPNAEISSSYYSNFEMFCKYLCYDGRGVPGEIHDQFDDNPWLYPALNNEINLEQLTHGKTIKLKVWMQEVLERNWHIVAAGWLEPGHEEDRARIGVYYLIEWIQKQKKFTLEDLLIAASSTSVLISNHQFVRDEIARSLLWVLRQHQYLTIKHGEYRPLPSKKKTQRKPYQVRYPDLESPDKIAPTVTWFENENHEKQLKIAMQQQRELPQRNLEAAQRNILFVSANPHGSETLNLDEEKAAIEQCVQYDRNRIQLALTTLPKASIKAFDRALLEANYQIIHFSGHTNPEGYLLFEEQNGQESAVTLEGFATYIGNHALVECVVLNACKSIDQGKLIPPEIPIVIAMAGDMLDKAAILFAEGFYQAVGAGKDYAFAYKNGCARISTALGLQNYVEIPQFLPDDIRKTDESKF